MQVSVLWSGDTYLTMKVSCPNGSQNVGGTSAMAASLPTPVRELPGHGERAGVGDHLVDLHDLHRPCRWVVARPGRAPPAHPRRRWARRSPRCWPSPPCPPCSSSWSAIRWREGSGTRGGRCRATRCACSSWRPGWPGPPAARSFSGRWWRTCAAARSGRVGARRSWTASRRASRSACSRCAPSAPRSRCRPVPAPGARRERGQCGDRRDGRRPPCRTLAGDRTRRQRPTPCGRATRSGTSRDDRLGDGADWTMLAALNLGRDMGGGARFVDPDQLRTGWRLRLPEEARRGRRRHAPPARPPIRCARTGAGHLPELVALGLGSLACAALARRAGRRRRSGARFTGELRPRPAAVRGSVGHGDAPAPLRRACPRSVPSRPPTASWACPSQGLAPGHRSGPICVSPSGVTSGSPGRQPRTPPPDGFAPAEDGTAWHVSHGRARRPRPLDPLPARRLPDRRRRRGHLARPARDRATCCPSSARRRPRSGGRRGRRSARGRGRTRSWSTEDPDDPGLRSEVGRRPTGWRDASCSAGTRPRSPTGGRGTLRRRHHGAGRRQRPDRPGRPAGRHAPPHGPGRPPPPPVRGDRPRRMDELRGACAGGRSPAPRGVRARRG